MHQSRSTPAIQGRSGHLLLILLLLASLGAIQRPAIGQPATGQPDTVRLVTLQSDTKTRIINYLLGASSDPAGLDRNGDGKVDIADVIFEIEHVAPIIASFALNNGAASTPSRSVTLNSVCQGPTAYYYMASEAADFSGTTWQWNTAAPAFMLSAGNGTKKVYYKVMSEHGVESAVASDTIDLLEIGSLTVGAAAVTGTIDTAGAADWFQFTVSAASSYAIDTAAGTLAGTSLSFYGPNSMTTLLGSDDNTGTAQAATLALTLNPGTYYVKIQATSAGATGNYTIAVSNLGALKVNSFALANGAALVTNLTVTLNNACTGRPAFYQASESSTFKNATWLPYDTAPTFTLSTGNASKKVYFKVRDAGGTESAVVSDSITLKVMTPLPVDGTIAGGSLATAAGENWYILTVTTSALYTLQTYAGSLADTALGLSNKPDPVSGEWLAWNLNINTDDLTSQITIWLDPGTYYARVTSGDGSTGSYTIRAWPTVNQVLSLNGAAVAGNIASAGDVNWYRFTVASTGTYTIAADADGLTGGLTDGYLELYSSTFQKIALNDDRVGTVPSYMPAITASLAPGAYIVRMAGATAAKTGTYTIKAYSGAISGGVISLMLNGPTAAGSIGAPPTGSTYDNDWFQFIVTTENNYTIETAAGSLTGAYMVLSIDNGNGTWTQKASSNTNDTGSMPAIDSIDLIPGTYYIAITGLATTDRGTYKIHVIY